MMDVVAMLTLPMLVLAWACAAVAHGAASAALRRERLRRRGEQGVLREVAPGERAGSRDGAAA